MSIAAASSIVAGHRPIDLTALQRGNLTPAEQQQGVSQQFEAILLRQFLQDSVGSMMGGSGDASGSVYGYMLTDAIAQKVSEGGGMGLAPLISKQLGPVHPAAAAPAAGPLPISTP